MHELLTIEEMAEADRRAVAMGVPSLTLMENAGRAVADEAAKMVPPGAKIAVLCGRGNNGGDGFVAARILKERGYDVRVACLVPVAELKGDAAVMAGKWEGEVLGPDENAIAHVQLIVDALYGAGINRRLEGSAVTLVLAANKSKAGVLAVDVPSGLDGNSGSVRGNIAIEADRTVTFFRRKPGHLLLPGRELSGILVVADIGISEEVLSSDAADFDASDFFYLGHAAENHPAHYWGGDVPLPKVEAHKYTRGHAVVVSGPPFQTGAARLAARGALRMGAGLVTLAGSSSATAINAAHLTAIMLAVCNRAQDLAEILSDKRKNAVLIGPGCGVGQETRDLVEVVLASGAAVVLDADALTSFAEADQAAEETVTFGFTSSRTKAVASPAALFSAIRAKPDRPVVMTPHEGEFKRLFPQLSKLPSKLDRAREAAKLSGAIVVLKGPDTVIASPDGVAVINTNAPPTLATAGSGDVLAGFITGFLAQGMPAFHAACASVWLHGECANVFGPGLIAEDLPEMLPQVLAKLVQASTSF
jgi:ADP-dependent NAD(P)H-hydrate dehydratase / NAD(P)H-hydrate epimerase